MIYKKINFCVVLFMLCSSLYLSLLECGNISRLLVYIGLLISIGMPFIFYKTKYMLSHKQLTLYYIFIFLADYLGCVWQLYDYICWYDCFVHFLAGIFIYIIGMFILDVNMLNNNVFFSIFFGLMLVMAVSGLWEIFEFSVDKILKIDMQNVICTGVSDTMEDIIIAFIGGIICCEYKIFSVRTM